MQKNSLLFYIDPQSTGNLSAYDHGVLSEVTTPVCYICSRYYDNGEMPPNVQKHPIFRYNRIGNPLLKLLSYLWSMCLLFRMIAKNRPEVIHVQWFRVHHIDFMFYWLVKHLFHPTIIITAHNVLPHDTGTRYKGIYNRTYRLFDHIIVHAEATRHELQNEFHVSQEKIHVIHHGTLKMNIDPAKQKSEEPTFRQKYQTEDRIVFTSLGDQTPYKGIDLLIDIWQTTPALNTNDHVRLIIAGKNSGVDYSAISGFDNVTITEGRIPNEEYHFLICHTDVYLLPYRKISQSGALFTAMEEHTPVLVSDAGGLSEPLDMAKIGWKVKAGDHESLRKALLHLASHPEEIQEVKNNTTNWETVCNNYSWKTISQQTAHLYEKALKHTT